MTVVVGPLNALIMDQVQKMQKIGISAEYLSSDQHFGKINHIYSKLNSSK